MKVPAKHGHVPGAPGAEAEVRSDPDLGGVQCRKFVKKGRRGARRVGTVETGHDRMMDAEAGHAAELLLDRGEDSGAGENGLGWWIEGIDDRGNPERPRRRDRLADDRLVAAVHPIEGADGDDGGVESQAALAVEAHRADAPLRATNMDHGSARTISPRSSSSVSLAIASSSFGVDSVTRIAMSRFCSWQRCSVRA